MDPKIRAQAVRWGAWLVCIAFLGLVLPLGFFAAAPVGCTSCHEESVAAASASPHASVTCVTCHVGPTAGDRARFGYYQAFGMALPVVETRGSVISSVPDTACTSCHDLERGVMEAGGLRINHETCAEGATCVECHSTAAHPDSIDWPKTYSMEACLSCHGAREASADCETCHTGKRDKTLPNTGTFPITHGPQWRQTHGMGEMTTCAACHDSGSCVKCHGPGVPHEARFVSLHPQAARSSDAGCDGCHQESFCDDCHGYAMPHPESFTREHRELVGADGDEGCRKCHDPVDCVNCHEMHVHPGGAR